MIMKTNLTPTDPHSKAPIPAAGGNGEGGGGTPPSRRPRRLLTTKEASRRLSRSFKTLQNWRVKGVGPRFIVIEGRVFYVEDEIDSFGRFHQSTSEYSSTKKTPGNDEEDT